MFSHTSCTVHAEPTLPTVILITAKSGGGENGGKEAALDADLLVVISNQYS